MEKINYWTVIQIKYEVAYIYEMPDHMRRGEIVTMNNAEHLRATNPYLLYTCIRTIRAQISLRIVAVY